MSAEDVVNEFMERIVNKNLDAACELVSADVEYDNVPMGKVYGPDGIKGFLAPMVEGLDEVDWVIHRQVASDTLVLNERTDRFGKDGKWMELPVAGVFEVHDGRITLWRDYFDMNTMATQLADLTS
jgi:limonene-1,2-epoxide hydrolase